MKYLITGFYGGHNFGDELFLHTFKQLLNTTPKNMTIVSFYPQNTIAAGYPNTILAPLLNWKANAFGFKRLIKSINSADTIIIGGGQLLQDDTSWRFISIQLLIAALGKILSKKVLILGVGSGKLSAKATHLLRQVIPQLDGIILRDAESKNKLSKIVKNTHMDTCTDLIITYIRDKKLTPKKAKKKVGINLRLYKLEEINLNEVSKYINLLAKKYQVIFIATENDEKVYQELKRSSPKLELFTSENNNEYISLINELTFVISMRLHFIITSSTLRVPCVGLSYDTKVSSYCKQNTISFLKLKNINSKQLELKAKESLSKDNKKIQQKIYAQNDKNKALINKYLESPNKKISFVSKIKLLYSIKFIYTAQTLSSIIHVVKYPFNKLKRRINKNTVSESIIVMDKEIYNFPTRVPWSTYSQIEKTIKQRTKKIPNQSTYLGGTLTIPGLSDMDFIVIAERITPELKNCFSFKDKNNCILPHSPLFLNKELLKWYSKYINNSNEKWKYLTGDKIKLNPTSKNHKKVRRIDDLIINNYPELLEFKHNSKINFSKLLSKLHKVKYLKHLITDKKITQKITAFEKKIIKIRNEVFDSPKEELSKKALSLLDEAIMLIKESIEYFENNNTIVTQVEKDTKIYFYSDKYGYEFCSDWKTKESSILTKIYLPPVLASTLQVYSQEKNTFGKFINSRLKGKKLPIIKSSEEVIRNVGLYYQKHIDFAKTNSIKDGPIVNFDLHYRPTSKIKRIKRIISKKKEKIIIKSKLFLK